MVSRTRSTRAKQWTKPVRPAAGRSKEIPQVAGSLEEALNELDLDREFLTAGGVFTNEAIDAYITLRREEDDRVRMTPHPVEFELYYSV